MNHYTIPKPPHGSADWLAARWQNEAGEKRITASVAAAVHGCHPYVTMADLAVELLADEPPQPKEANNAMRRGTILEGPIVKWAGEILGVTIEEPQQLYCYEEPGVRMLATMDGLDGGGQFYEVKTYNRRWKGDLPDHWYWQGVHQAICANVPNIEWIVFDSDLDLQFVVQPVSSDERQTHIEAVRKFLSFIDMGMIPEGADVGYDHAVRLHPMGDGQSVALDATVYDTLERMALADAQIKSAETVKEQCKGELGLLLGNAEYGQVDGTTVVTWKSATRSSFDTKAFEKEHPALYAKFKKETTYRTMRITAKEEK
jgi:predicted phage-related endonuclease